MRVGLSGWVRNLSSGNIGCGAGGAQQGIDEFIMAVRTGPDGADVKQVITLTPPASLELPTPFTILK